MRIIFMGTPDFAVEGLEAIQEAGHEILLVISQEDKGGEIYGPFPATVYKLKDNFRQIIYIKHESHDIILQLRDRFIREVKEEDRRDLILLQFDLL